MTSDCGYRIWMHLRMTIWRVDYVTESGINKLTISEQGLVYVMYVTKTLDDPAAAPVKIHFASGKVNGYFDSQNPEHNGRWSELLNKATNRYFDVLGKYAHLTFETSDLRTYTVPREMTDRPL